MPRVSTKKLLAEIRSHITNEDYDRAFQLAQEVLRNDGSNYHALVFVGVAASAQQKFDVALTSYQSAVELRPELPLAYKGIVQTLTKPQSPNDPLRLARAYYGLGVHSPDRAGDALSRASDLFFSLATDDPQLCEEAISVLKKLQASYGKSEKSLNDDILVYRICKLAHLKAVQLNNGDEKAKKLDEIVFTSPLSEALDDLEKVLLRNNAVIFYDGTAELVIERACLRCLRNDDFTNSLMTLRHLQAYDAILRVAETDYCFNAPEQERLLLSFRSLHLRPYQLAQTRAKSIIAAHLYDKTDDSESAIQLLTAPKLGNSLIIGVPKVVPFHSCTHSFVSAYIHFCREEYKRSIEICSVGQSEASKCEYLKRMQILFSLILGAAYCGDRKYQNAMAAFERVRHYANTTGDAWLTAASNRGLIDTAIIAHGRRSRAATTAMEEAASSTHNLHGSLECVWSDALCGDVDLPRFTELTKQSIEAANNTCENDVFWEYKFLDPRFVTSSKQLAAVASSRLGQLILKEQGYCESALANAQKYQMEAAGFSRGFSDPFAHLGFIFEQLAKHKDEDRMIARALRCYERAFSIDACNSIAGRRSARILAHQGSLAEAADIAQNASARNPKARWAFNILGWWRINCGKNKEAGVAFISALRGRPTRSAKEEDQMFGTDVGATVEDNDFIVDVDSWRGLSVAYRLQGKMRASHACLDDAIRLIEKPPVVHTVHLSFDLTAILSKCRTLVELEKNTLMIITRKVTSIENVSKFIVKDVSSRGIAGYYLAETHMLSAAEEWIKGCYYRALRTRMKAGEILENWFHEQLKQRPLVNYSVILKKLGDIWSEVVGEYPNEMAQFLSYKLVDDVLWNAIEAYSKASHFTPWDLNIRIQDLAAVLQRRAVFLKDPTLAQVTLNLLLKHNVDISLIAMSFLILGTLSSPRVQKASEAIAARVMKVVDSKRNKLLLEASLASQAKPHHDISSYAEAAVDVTRADPTDWRAWFVIGKVREVDAQRHNWPADKVRSCDEAYGEADRLGGGPAAVMGRYRCMSNGVSTRAHSAEGWDIYSDACFVLSLARRIGVTEPLTCKEIIDKFNLKRAEKAQIENEQNVLKETMNLSHVHTFPFIAAIRESLSIFLDGSKVSP